MRGLTGLIATRSSCEDRVVESGITAAVDLFFLLNTTEKPLEGVRLVVVKSEQEHPFYEENVHVAHDRFITLSSMELPIVQAPTAGSVCRAIFLRSL